MNLRVRPNVKWAQLIELSAFAPRRRGVYKFFYFFFLHQKPRLLL